MILNEEENLLGVTTARWGLEVCKTRWLMNRKIEVLIKWKDMPSYENSWEEADSIANQFPSFHLEDKVELLGEGNERTPFLEKTHTRQPRTEHTKGRDTFKGAGLTFLF